MSERRMRKTRGICYLLAALAVACISVAMAAAWQHPMASVFCAVSFLVALMWATRGGADLVRMKENPHD